MMRLCKDILTEQYWPVGGLFEREHEALRQQ